MLNFEDFKCDRKLPFWYDDNVHKDVVQFIMLEKRLQGCKFLNELSSNNKTKPEFDLKWAKTEIVDHIDLHVKQVIVDKEVYEMELKKFLGLNTDKTKFR